MIVSTSKKHHHSSRSARADRANPKRALRRAMNRHLVGLDASLAAQCQLVKLFTRIERIFEQIDEAFAGEPFLPGIAPTAPLNRQRFNAYLEGHGRAMKLFGRAIELWMFACGMKREDNWVPLLVERMRQDAATRSIKADVAHEIKQGDRLFAKQSH